MIEELQTTGSETWSNYKSYTPNDNVNKYDDGTYDLVRGERYGIDPQYAQANGSFYIDCNAGKIHFSSNLNGKNVILKYLSDGLGTDGEMQVHKFAEEAMYKWIAYAVLASRANTPEYMVQRLKRERFAAVRTAKLRLSNLNIEELRENLQTVYSGVTSEEALRQVSIHFANQYAAGDEATQVFIEQMLRSKLDG